jgi:acetoin utilization protein AcuB
MPSPATSLSVWEINYLVGRLAVDEVMTQTLITIDPNRDVREAARILIDHKIGALPVLDGRALVGIVTDTDLLRALAKDPAELAVAG